MIVLRDLRIPRCRLGLLVPVVDPGRRGSGRWWSSSSRSGRTPRRRRAPYIERSIEATRQAYGLTDDMVDYVSYRGVGTTPPRSCGRRHDHRQHPAARPDVLSRTFTQFQQRKNFYGFPATLDIDRYRIDGELRDYVVGARELTPDRLIDNQTRLDQPAHRLHPRQRFHRVAGQPGQRGGARCRPMRREQNSGYPDLHRQRRRRERQRAV